MYENQIFPYTDITVFDIDYLCMVRGHFLGIDYVQTTAQTSSTRLTIWYHSWIIYWYMPI